VTFALFVTRARTTLDAPAKDILASLRSHEAASRVPGGRRRSGHCPFSSGCNYAQQCTIIGTFLGEKGDPRSIAYLLVPLAEVEIVDDWCSASSAPAASRRSCATCSCPSTVP